MIQRAIVFATFGLAAACVSTAASARVDVGGFVNTPGPFYAPPPVVYAPPPPVVYAPVQPAYGYGYGYRGDYYRGYRGHGDHGRHRGWDKHHGHGR
ncbi:hypothetical protein PQR34_03220 [Paraburkholderia sediminicola]|uniref:hypothetical protein n=1 Tax=Paraburkholderia sediminicola TaxID=458836 RepID=UPI0038BCA7C4